VNLTLVISDGGEVVVVVIREWKRVKGIEILVVFAVNIYVRRMSQTAVFGGKRDGGRVEGQR